MIQKRRPGTTVTECLDVTSTPASPRVKLCQVFPADEDRANHSGPASVSFVTIYCTDAPLLRGDAVFAILPARVMQALTLMRN